MNDVSLVVSMDASGSVPANPFGPDKARWKSVKNMRKRKFYSEVNRRANRGDRIDTEKMPNIQSIQPVLKTDVHSASAKQINRKMRTGEYVPQDLRVNVDASAKASSPTRSKEMSAQTKREMKRNRQIRDMNQLDSHDRFESDYMRDAKAALQNYIIRGDKQTRRFRFSANSIKHDKNVGN